MATNEELHCTAQRHMDVEFFTYNAMLATAKAGRKRRMAEGKPPGELIFSGALFSLANKINRAVKNAGMAVEKLERDGWIVLVKGQERNKRGNWSTVEYRVIEHEEYAITHICPAAKYIKIRGERWVLREPGKAAPGLMRRNVARYIASTGNDDLAAKVSTLTDHQVEVLSDSIRWKKSQVATDTRNRVTRFSLESAPLPSASPTCLPAQSAAENGGQAGGNDPSGNDETSAPIGADNTEQRWKRFIDTADSLPEKLANATPRPEGMRAVLAQLDECGRDFYAARWLVFEMGEWAENRTPKLETLNAYVWGDGPNPEKHRFGWLKECTPGMIANATENAAGERKRFGDKGLPGGKPNFLI